MKNLLLVVLLLLVGSANGIIAQSADQKATSEAVSLDENAIASWTSDRHNFGNIPQGEPVTHSFILKNLKSDPLFIDNVRTTCGCTASSWTKEPILPGESGNVEISFNAAKEGKFNKVVKVYLNGQKDPEYLIIQGEVMPKG